MIYRVIPYGVCFPPTCPENVNTTGASNIFYATFRVNGAELHLQWGEGKRSTKGCRRDEQTT